MQLVSTMRRQWTAKTDPYLSSWDIKRDFDCIPKQLLIVSCICLEASPDVVEYMVGIDMGGCFVFYTLA